MDDRNEIGRVEDGEATAWDGRRIHFATLLARRWGWPKLAAKQAAAYLQAEAEKRGEKAHLELAWGPRTEQQDALFEAIPNLRADLCTGIAHRTRRTAHHDSNRLNEIVIRFPQAITDDGLTGNVLHALANRLGCSAEDMRGRHCPVCARTIPRSDLEGSFGHVTCPDCQSPTVKVTTISQGGTRLTLDVMANLFEVLP